MKNRLFPALFIGTCLATLVVVVALNLVGNVNGISPLLYHPARNDRAWKTIQLDRLVRAGRSPQGLILGSSRVMQIRPLYVQAITGKRFFNYGLAMGRIVDSLAAFRHALRIGVKPEIVILGIDEATLSGDIGSFEIQLAGSRLFYELPVVDKIRILSNIPRMINLKTTWQSLQLLLHSAPTEHPPVLRWTEEGVLFLEDGYMVYLNETRPGFNRLATLSGILARQEKNVETDCEFGVAVDPHAWQQFHELLALAQSNGIRLIAVFTPLHPQYVAKCFDPDSRRMHEQLRGRIAAECRRFDCDFHDCSSLESFGGDPNEFWDRVHQTSVNMQRLTNSLFGIPPSQTVIQLPPDATLVEKNLRPAQ